MDEMIVVLIDASNLVSYAKKLNACFTTGTWDFVSAQYIADQNSPLNKHMIVHLKRKK